MNTVSTFDTHRYIKHLTEKGFTEQQAEALADEQMMLLSENLASKDNLARVDADLKAEIARVEANLKAELARMDVKITQSKDELIKWIAGFGVGVVAALAALMVGLLS